MLKTKILHTLVRLSVGKEMAMAVFILRLVAEAIQKGDIRNVVAFVYKKLPPAWRHPAGPATEAEFLGAVEAGEKFFRALKALTVKNA